MSDLIHAQAVIPAGEWTGAADHVALDYEGRFLRRKRLSSAGGIDFLVDLAEVTNLTGGEAFRLDDGRLIEVRPGVEPCLSVTGNLTRLAWHIGNRHTPCQIEPLRLVIRQDHVLKAMLEQLGAKVTETVEPFRPEGGAYGMGRTMGHEHGATLFGHSHGDGSFHVHG
uniref:urease accessory protein UreE n=1 Tax=Paenirhodobacter enshiensis TaxID=1105367 RepID=UPI0035B44E29